MPVKATKSYVYAIYISPLCIFANLLYLFVSMFDKTYHVFQKRACNLDPVSSIVPNTPRLALQASPNARIIISAEIPFNVTYINDAFSAATGLHQVSTSPCSIPTFHAFFWTVALTLVLIQ